MNLHLVAEMPWLAAEPDSVWNISGTYARGRGTFQDCLAMVIDYDPAVDQPAFVLIHPAMHQSIGAPGWLIPADQVTSAYRLVLVLGNDPGTAYYVDEQDLIERETGR